MGGLKYGPPLLVSEASPQWGDGWKLHIAMHAHMWHMTEIHNLASAKKILQTRLKENGHLGKHTMDVLDLSMMKKMPADSMANGKKPGSTHSLVI